MDWEVPWDDTDNEAKRSISLDSLLLLILNDDLLLQLKVGESAKPSCTSLQLTLCKLGLVVISKVHT